MQQAIKDILEEETTVKHLKTNKNFDKVLSIASLIDKYEPSPDPDETVKVCAWLLRWLHILS